MLCNDQFKGGKVVQGCISHRYYVRSFRVQITGLVEGANDGRTMEQFREGMRGAARESARYGNWLLAQLFAADGAANSPQREWLLTKDGKPKLPAMPAVNGYRPDLFPNISGASLSALSQIVTGFYREHRFETFVSLNRSVMNYRFGYLPIEVRAADWSIRRSGLDNRFAFHGITIQPGKSWAVKVYCDARSLAQLAMCADGAAVPLGIKVVRRTKQPIPGTNGKPVKAWFFRVAALLPRKPKRTSHQEITLALGHDPGALLFGSLEDSAEVFEFPGTDIKKLIVGGDRSDRKRQQQDSLYRGIMPRRKWKRWSQDRTRAAENRQRKLNYLLHCAAASLTRWCLSHGVTSVDYERTDRGFVPHFPWRKLKDYIACSLEAAGIALQVVGVESVDDRSDLESDSDALAGRGSETA